MSEAQSSEENKEIKFDNEDLTPFEQTTIGGSNKCSVLNRLINVTSRNIAELIMDPDARKVVLSPINHEKGKKSIEEIRKARIGAGSIPIMTVFETKAWLKYREMSIKPAFRPGDLDEENQIKGIEIFLLQNDRRMDLPDNILTDLPLNIHFKNALDYVGSEDNVMRYNIKTLKQNAFEGVK
jgi:hypothetical protein